jgi:hypothetical protein
VGTGVLAGGEVVMHELRDITGAEVVGIQVSPLGDKIWVCVDGQCVLRVSRIMQGVELTDSREVFATESE